jgi:hypothetical protein
MAPPTRCSARTSVAERRGARSRRRAGPIGGLGRRTSSAPDDPASRRRQRLGRFSPDGRFLAVGHLRGRAQVFSTARWKPVTPAFAGGRATWAAFTRDGRTLSAGTPTERSASGTSRVVRRSAAAAAGHTQLAGRADLHTRPHTPHRGLPERSRLPLGHPNRFACPPGMPRRRVQAHARGMRRVPARAGV